MKKKGLKAPKDLLTKKHFYFFIMKRFLLAAGLLIMGASSAFSTQILTINGETVEKVVSRMTFDGDNVVLHFGNETSTHDMEAVSLEFKQFDGIDNIQAGFITGLVGDLLVIEGVENGTVIEIYNMQGILCTSQKTVGNSAEIDMSGFNAGAYILRAGNQIVKFVK